MPRTRREKHDHSEHLLRPSDEDLQRHLTPFAIEREAFTALGSFVICDFKEPILISSRIPFDPSIYEGAAPIVHYVTPKSLDQLKELTGVSNRVFEQNPQHCGPSLCDVGTQLLGGQGSRSFGRLERERQTALLNAGQALLYGRADADVIKRPPYDALVKQMVKRAVRLPTLLAQNLIVCPDQVVHLQSFASLYFNNVIVYGNGQIFFGPGTKLHAYQIQHV